MKILIDLNLDGYVDAEEHKQACIEELKSLDHAGCNVSILSCEYKPKAGLYKVVWAAGGSSLASIGINADGTRWIAPTNWVTPGSYEEIQSSIGSLERLNDSIDSS